MRAGRYVEFLLLHSMRSGPLVLHVQSCATLECVEKEETQVVLIAWAVMGFMYAKYPHPEPIEQAVKLVM